MRTLSPRFRGKSLQKGFFLTELMAATAIAAILAIVAAPAIVWKAEEAGMEATGVYMGAIRGGMERYQFENWLALQDNTPITGFVDPYQPTITELRTARYLASPNFPTLTPQRSPVEVSLIPQNCPGQFCQILGVAYATQPLASYLASPGAGGFGGAAHYGNGAELRHAQFRVPNPVSGQPEGIISIGSYLDTAVYNAFVRRGDPRNTTLNGGLELNGLMPSGETLDVNGPSSFEGTATFNSRIGVRDSVSSRAVGLTEVATPGTPCSAPGDVPAITNGAGAIVTDAAATTLKASSNGGIVMCTGGPNSVWVTVAQAANVNGACTVNGSTAVSPTGVVLYCSNGQFITQNQRFGRFALSDTVYVQNGSSVSKPVCPSGGSPRIFIDQGAIDASFLRSNFQVGDSGVSWLISNTDGSGNALLGDAIASVGCIFSS